MKIWAPVLAAITEAWLVDLNGVAIDPENFIFNPLCKNRIKPRAQACVSAVLSDFNGENEEILDNILNCPCMERCFNGAPCRTKGDYIDFSKRNTHEDFNSALDAQPLLAEGVVLSEPVTLFWSDEFETGSTVDTQMWSRATNAAYKSENLVVTDGNLDIMMMDDGGGNYSGAKTQAQWSKVASGEFNQEMVKFGYFEAKLKVPTDRKGRSCKLALVPEDEWNLNPNEVTGDLTAKKGARIVMMSNSLWDADAFNTAVDYYNQADNTGDDVTGENIQADEPLGDNPHTYGLFWTPTKLEWYFDGVMVRDEGAHKGTQHLVPEDIPLFFQMQSQILNWLMGGPDQAPSWPEQCRFDYVRHFALDTVNENCLPKDKFEQNKCEQMYQNQGLSSSETAELIMKNCPCHFHCFNGCANCGTYECDDASLVDPATDANAQPGAQGALDPGRFVLEYSDEFEGTLLNTNKWISMEKGQSGRKDQSGLEFYWDRTLNTLDGEGHLVQTVTKRDEIDADGNPFQRYVSGRISTTGIVSPLYGFFEAKFDTLPVEGMQSAWWLWAENGLWNYDFPNDHGCPPAEDYCVRKDDDVYNPHDLTYPQMVPNHCHHQPGTTNAWWGSELDIIEARAKKDIMSTNIHTGGYKDGAGCYFNNHEDLLLPGLHDGEHTFGLRWKKDLLEWYYDGQLVRTIDDPEQVSRGAGFFIMSQGLFGGGWFVEGNIETYVAENGLTDEDIRQNGIVSHKVDYIRYWKELEPLPNESVSNKTGNPLERASRVTMV